YSDRENSVMAFRRLSDDPAQQLTIVLNFTPVVRCGYHIGVPEAGEWKEVFNTDDLRYGGSGVLNGTVRTHDSAFHGLPQSLSLVLPPLGMVILKPARS
ncbi:MAG: alpha amylase C-terminal domain-containing protein, partial [Bacteroidota bacterium]